MQPDVSKSANLCTLPQENRDPTEPTRGQPRSGALLSGSGSPLLDKEEGNVPGVLQTPTWRSKHFGTRRKILDHLRYWQYNGYQCLWVTLTSARGNTLKRLRKDFQVLRKRINREFGFGAFQYVCVDTLEGNGVLHMIWAYKDPNPLKRASFYIPFEWLQAQWKEIHGAFHVNVQRIGMSDKDATRLARYLVAQYCGNQDGLVRVSRSKLPIPLVKMRRCLLRELRNTTERYQIAHEWPEMSQEDFTKRFNGWFWGTFRAAWDELITKLFCNAFGVQFAWLEDRLVRI